MKKLQSLALVSLLSVSLSGCVIVAGEHDFDNDSNSWRAQQSHNRQVISELTLNSDRASVVSKMGAASYSEAFVKDNDEYRILYYRTQHRHSDGDTSKDETTPLIFKNDKLIGWGDEVLISVKPI